MRPARADAAGDPAARARNAANMGMAELYAELARSMTEEQIARELLQARKEQFNATRSR